MLKYFIFLVLSATSVVASKISDRKNRDEHLVPYHTGTDDKMVKRSPLLSTTNDSPHPFETPPEASQSLSRDILKKGHHGNTVSKATIWHHKVGEESTNSRPSTIKALHASKYSLGQPSWLKTKQAMETIEHSVKKELEGPGRDKYVLSDSHGGSDQELVEKLVVVSGTDQSRKEPEGIIQDESSCFSTDRPQCFQPAVLKYRTIDGTCNNLKKPMQGASGTPFRRLVPALYEDEIGTPCGHEQATSGGDVPFQPPLPSARLITETLYEHKPLDHPTLNHMFMQWGQFVAHDITLGFPNISRPCLNCEFVKGDCEPILVPEDDADFPDFECLFFPRVAACNRTGVRTQMNLNTAYLDGSIIYGSTRDVENEVRSFQDGLLEEGDPLSDGGKAMLPFVTDEQRASNIMICDPPDICYLAGQILANQHVLLVTMHTLWVREHNRIARELKAINIHWDDEHLYQEARKIVGAIMQKITYLDYLPKLFGQSAYNEMIGKYTRYKRRADATISSSFGVSGFRFGHSTIQNTIDRLGPGYEEEEPIDTTLTFLNNTVFIENGGTDKFLRGMLTQPMQYPDEFISPAIADGNPILQITSTDIQRQRDVGIAPFVVWSKFCRKKYPNLGSSDIQNQEYYDRLLKLYGSFENVDFWVGGIAEDLLEGSIVPKTFACILALNFAQLRDGDRFYFERRGVFSHQQRREILKSSLSRVVCDNADDISSVPVDAFLHGQTRVNCSEIPSINLSKWKQSEQPYGSSTST